MSPNAFLCHASEDKDSFVLTFAEKLRDKGIRVWLDKWEMLPGDSLVTKIFEEGLKNADAVIIVLSRASVSKPWVRQELETSVVQRIEQGTKLIPVVIDDCEIPNSLRSTLYERIDDLKDYSESLDRIVGAIYNTSLAPSPGTPPRYASTILKSIPALSATDNLVLKTACERLIAGERNIIEPPTMMEEGLTAMQLTESSDVLANQGYFNVHTTLGPGPYPVSVTSLGLEEYAHAYVPGFDTLEKEIVAQIVNHDVGSLDHLSRELEAAPVLLALVVDSLGDQGYLSVAHELGNYSRRFVVRSQAIKRLLD